MEKVELNTSKADHPAVGLSPMEERTQHDVWKAANEEKVSLGTRVGYRVESQDLCQISGLMFHARSSFP